MDTGRLEENARSIMQWRTIRKIEWNGLQVCSETSDSMWIGDSWVRKETGEKCGSRRNEDVEVCIGSNEDL